MLPSVLNALAYKFRFAKLHPLETVPERKQVILRLVGQNQQLVSSLQEGEMSCIENLLFHDSRAVLMMSERLKTGSNNMSFRYLCGFLFSIVVDVLSRWLKVVMIVAIAMRLPPTRLRGQQFVIFSSNLRKELFTPYTRYFSDFGLKPCWIISPSPFMFKLQKTLVHDLRSKNEHAEMLNPIHTYRDLFGGVRRWLSAIHRMPVTNWMTPAGFFMSMFLLPFLIEMEIEKQKASILIETGCKLMLTQDEDEAVSYYRKMQLIKAGVTVVGLMHGLGVYGPNQCYSKFLVWGDYFRDKYCSGFGLPLDDVQTVSCPYYGIYPDLNCSSPRDTVLVLLQPVTAGNSWGQITKMLTAASSAIARVPDHASRLTVVLHPRQGFSSMRIKRFVASRGIEADFIKGLSSLPSILDRTYLAITNFSTAGYDAILSGSPTLFFQSSRNLSPLLSQVPECGTSSAQELEAKTRNLLASPAARRGMLIEQLDAMRYFYGADGEKRIEEVCSRLALKLGYLKQSQLFAQTKTTSPES